MAANWPWERRVGTGPLYDAGSSVGAQGGSGSQASWEGPRPAAAKPPAITQGIFAGRVGLERCNGFRGGLQSCSRSRLLQVRLSLLPGGVTASGLPAAICHPGSRYPTGTRRRALGPP